MLTIQLDDELGQAVQQLAKNQHRPAEQLISEAIIEMLEDYHDVKLAEEAIKRIESGEERTYTLKEVEQYLNEMDG